MEPSLLVWAAGIVVVFSIVRFSWNTYIHPANVLGRQGINMNWVAVGRVADELDYKNVKYARDGLEALVSFRNENVELIRPSGNRLFTDFIELERWLAKNEVQRLSRE